MNHGTKELRPMAQIPNQLFDVYVDVKELVISSGFGSEIDWQTDVCLSEINETDFLREGAWAILSAGMRESVVRSKFPALSDAFLDWQSADAIAVHRCQCSRAALQIFRHELKINAIIDLALTICAEDFFSVKQRIIGEGVEYLESFYFIGPITRYHFAKNIGLNVAKPDRHLCRISELFGYDSPQAFCQEIAFRTGDSISVVDSVIWRFATLQRDYLEWFKFRIDN